jgi:hypothetical protein
MYGNLVITRVSDFYETRGIKVGRREPREKLRQEFLAELDLLERLEIHKQGCQALI